MLKRKKIISVIVFIAMALITLAAQGSAIDLPKTGQTECYDHSGAQIPCEGTGQDGDISAGVAWPKPRFVVSGDCVTDGLTGLMWTRNANIADGPKQWQAALDFVEELNNKGGLCGHADWRLPNVIELGSLLNKQEANSAAWLNTQGFENAQEYEYWTSTTRANLKEHAWRIQMTFGHQTGSSKSVNGYIWPVRTVRSLKK